jgi:hypothetical protein
VLCGIYENDEMLLMKRKLASFGTLKAAGVRSG